MTAAGGAGHRLRVLLVDDQSLVRAGFRLVLEQDPSIDIVAEAADGAQAITQTRRHKPDVVLMDVRMPVMDGLQATRAILESPDLANIRIVVLTTYELDDYITEAILAGASGFLLKDIEPDDLRQAVHTVAEGHALLSPRITQRVLDALRSHGDRRPKEPERLDVLTSREREVLALVGRGLSNTEIGGELFMSPATAKTHVSRVMTKLGARDRAQLVVIAHETRLLDADEH